MSSRSELTALLAQTGWIRGLARTLASDPHLAEDLAQDAWVAALEQPPELARPVRGWLATVLRHRWLDLHRQRARQHRRERAAARDEAMPSSHDVVEKAAAHRRVVEAVLELDEPQRTTVLLRFFEGLPQREIATRMQTTAATVNSRLTRALAKLRERIARDGGLAAWLPLLAPLPTEPPIAPVAVLGVLTMKIALPCVAVAATLTAGLAWWLAREPAPATDFVAAAPTSPSVAAATGPAAGASEAAGAPAHRTTLATLPEPLPAPVPAAAALRGRVLDATGRAAAGIALCVSPGDATAACTSDAGGWFELVPAAVAETIVAADGRYATVLAASARVHRDTQPTVVVAARLDLGGVVLDEERAPLPHALVELRLPAGFGAAWGFALDYSVPQRWRTRSGGDGRFRLPVPVVDGACVHVALAGFEPVAVPSPQQTTDALEIVLARPREAPSLLRGIVLLPSGARAEGARVAAGSAFAVTDAQGAFALDVRSASPRLMALKAGLLPAVFEPARDASGRPQWPTDELVLQLGGEPLSLRGRIVDADGAPVPGARVWLDDPTPFGSTPDARLAAESLLAGDERFWSYQLTDSDGTFALLGLLPRSYRVQAVDPRTLASIEGNAAVPQRSALELRLPTRDVHPLVAGRVVTSAGRPIAGVKVRLFRITYEVEHEGGTDNDSVESAPVVTGDDGAFAFRDVAQRDVNVIATGDTILGAAAFLRDERDPERIELVASLRLHLQVELGEPKDRADALRVFDSQGKRVVLSVFRGGGSHADFEVPILDGRSVVLSVEDRAAVLALYRAGVEVARIPLHLAPGITNVVRY